MHVPSPPPSSPSSLQARHRTHPQRATARHKDHNIVTVHVTLGCFLLLFLLPPAAHARPCVVARSSKGPQGTARPAPPPPPPPHQYPGGGASSTTAGAGKRTLAGWPAGWLASAVLVCAPESRALGSSSSSSSAAAASPRHGLRPEREGRCSPPGPAGGTALQPGHGHGWLCLIHDAAAAELHLALPGHSALHMRMQMSGIPAFAGRGHRPLRTTAHNLQGGEGGAVFCLTSRLKHNDIRRQNEVDQLQCSLR